MATPTPWWVQNFFGRLALFQSGTPIPAQPNLNFDGAGVSVTPDPANRANKVTIPGVVTSTPHSGVGGMNDADFAVAETSGDVYIGSGTAFSADRKLTLPAAPTPGMKITWADECVTAGGSLAAHNLIVDGNGSQVQSGGTDQTGGIVNASTYTATMNAWPPGSTLSLFFNGTFWKVLT